MEVKCLENGTLMKIYFHVMASVLVCVGVHMCRFFMFAFDFIRTYVHAPNNNSREY